MLRSLPSTVPQGGTKEKDWAKKKQNKGFMKAPKIFKAPKTTVVEDSGAGSPHHHRQTSNQPFSPGSPPLGKQNDSPPEREPLETPWRNMEHDEEEDKGGYEHQSHRLEQFSAPRDDLNYQIEKRLAIIETQMAEIRQLLRNQRRAEPVPRAKPTQTVSLSRATGKASRRGDFSKSFLDSHKQLELRL